MIVNYKIIERTTVSQLVTAVKEEINIGWQPFGGPTRETGQWYQAVTWETDVVSHLPIEPE